LKKEYGVKRMTLITLMLSMILVFTFFWLAFFSNSFFWGSRRTELGKRMIKLATAFLLISIGICCLQVATGTIELLMIPITIEDVLWIGLCLVLFLSSSIGFGYFGGRVYTKKTLPTSSHL